VVKLSITTPDPIPGPRCAPTPPPTLIDGEEEFKVEAILNSRMRYNHLEYLVKWKGYDNGHNSWHAHHQFHTQEEVLKFHRENPGAAHYINVDNPNTTQTLEYTKDKYNAKIIKRRVSPKVPPTTYKGRRIK
jgi:hypothetical protein